MRRPRKLIEGYEYHVIARANRQEFILESDEIKEMFLQVLERAKQKYRFTVRNFCIMSNHVHLIIKPGKKESLSRIMQWILSVFALAFNRRFGYKGHVWYDRFKSKIIANFRQFVATFRYIAENPVRAGMVTRPEAYRYGGVRHIRDGDSSIVNIDPTLAALIDPKLPNSRLLAFKPWSH